MPDLSGTAAPAPRRLRRPYTHNCKCGRPLPEGVRRCSSRTCPEYAPTWARDTRRRLFVNLEQLQLSVMFSVTAPGADLYPFDPRFWGVEAHRSMEAKELLRPYDAQDPEGMVPVMHVTVEWEWQDVQEYFEEQDRYG